MTAFPTSSHPDNHPPSRLPSSGPTRSGSTSASRSSGSCARGQTDGQMENGTWGLQLRGSSRRLSLTPCRARTRLDPRDRSLSSGAARLSQEPLPDTGRVPPLAVSRRFSQPGSASPQRRRTARFLLRGQPDSDGGRTGPAAVPPRRLPPTARRPRGRRRGSGAAERRFPRTEPRGSSIPPAPSASPWRRPRVRSRHWRRARARPRLLRSAIGRCAERGGRSARGPFCPRARRHCDITARVPMAPARLPSRCLPSCARSASGASAAAAGGGRGRGGPQRGRARPAPLRPAPLRAGLAGERRARAGGRRQVGERGVRAGGAARRWRGEPAGDERLRGTLASRCRRRSRCRPEAGAVRGGAERGAISCCCCCCCSAGFSAACAGRCWLAFSRASARSSGSFSSTRPSGRSAPSLQRCLGLL